MPVKRVAGVETSWLVLRALTYDPAEQEIRKTDILMQCYYYRGSKLVPTKLCILACDVLITLGKHGR